VPAAVSRRFAALRRLAFSIALLATAAAVAPAAAAAVATVAEKDRPGFDTRRAAIAAFIDAEVERDGFARAELVALLSSARPRPELTTAMTHPIEKTLPWWQYRARFLTRGRIAGGVHFWQEHRALLEPVALEQGVPPEILVAILGMETNYGESTGSFRELDTLMTLAFDFPARGAQYRSELRAFLLLAREAGLDPIATRGSYAGALGAPQFLPSSYRRFAVDQSHAGRVDLWTDWADIFASMAKFLHARGWQRGGPIVAEVRPADGAHPAASGRLILNDTVGGLEARGLHIEGRLPAQTAVVLVAAELQDRTSYRAGFKNLHVIANYNPSINYALAVADLGSELRAALDRDTNSATPAERP
jgi:membrane-bound lytic murein transglycosylase B